MFDCLSNFFPKVINYVILEYYVPITHEFEETKYTESVVDNYVIRVNDYIYKYCPHTNILKKTTIQKNIINPCDMMCIYNNHIYVTAGYCINVFDNNCVLVYDISVFKRNGKFIIVSDNIFFCNNRDNVINIGSINDIVYNLSTKKHNIKIKREISFENDNIYLMKSFENNVYIITYTDKLYKYSYDNHTSKIYEKLDIELFDVCVIDDTIYVICNINSSYKLYIIHEDMNYKFKKIFDILYKRIYYVNNIIYIYSILCDDHTSYSVTRKKVTFKMLEKY